MTIARVHISRSSKNDSIETTPDVHQLQGCSISYDGPAQVSTYFHPTKDSQNDESLPQQESPSAVKNNPGATYTGYFRGRCLRGIDASIPEGYRGYIVESGPFEEPNDDGEQPVSEQHRITSQFDSYTSWKHHVIPDARRDPLHRCLQWCQTASSLHE
jgi:hypothetical protein